MTSPRDEKYKPSLRPVLIVKHSYFYPILVFIVSVLVVVLFMDRNLGLYDEGIILSSALRVMRGDVIHRDFYSVYGPGSYIALALLFSFLGKSFLVARAFSAAVSAGIVTVCYVLLRGRTGVATAIGTTTLILSLTASVGTYLWPIFPCLLLILIGSTILLGPNAVFKPSRLVAAGACAGVTAYFRYDVAFFMLTAHVLCVSITLFYQKEHNQRLSRITLGASRYTLGAVLVFLPGVLVFLAISPVSFFLDDIFGYGIKTYARTRSLPFPGTSGLRLSNVGVYFPIFISLVGITITILSVPRLRPLDKIIDTNVSPTLLLTVLTVVLLYKGLVRVSVLHMFVSIVPGMLLAAFVFDWLQTSAQRVLRWCALALAIITAIPAVAEAKSLLSRVRADGRSFVIGRLLEDAQLIKFEPDAGDLCLIRPELRGAVLPPPHALITRYITDHTDPHESILIATMRHDRIFANPEVLYFATNRASPTRWDVYDPGYQTRSDIQQVIINDLRRKDVRWIVRDASFDAIVEPNDSARSSGVFLLDSYLATHYRNVMKANLVEVWLRKDVATPIDNSPTSCKALVAKIP